MVVTPVPQPETRTQAQPHVTNDAVFTWWDYPIFTLLTIVNLGAMAFFLGQWFSRGDLRHDPLLFLLMTAALLLNLSMYQSRWLTLPFMRRPQPMAPRPGWKVGVATTFVPGTESLTMLEETLTALVAMDYPHDTWVLDEGDDDAVKDLCRQLGVHHFSRKHMPRYQTSAGTFEARTKHGNYNAWLYETGFERYDIIADFDPDHIPHRDFLLNVLGYFDDKEIGYVQAPQVYYNQKASFIARAAAEETYTYYSTIQMTSYAMGYPIVTGCHTTNRVTALKQVGGFAAHEADDLLVTVLYRIHGWKGVYVPKILAKGITPVDWNGYIGQQRRWARSVLDIKFRVYPKVARRLPRRERAISLLHGLYYLRGLSGALQVGLLSFMLVSGVTPRAFSLFSVPGFVVLLVAFQVCEFYRQRFFLDVKREWGTHWRAGIVQFAKWPYILLALIDAITHNTGPYTVTRKIAGAAKRHPLTLPHLLVVGTLGAAWCTGMALGHVHNPLLHVSCGILVFCSLVVVASGYQRFPDPYDPSLPKE